MLLGQPRFFGLYWQNQGGGSCFTVPETIYKFQPDRTVYLRGFNTFAAAASIHSATPAGFTVSGTFRDPADFAVAVLYDVDNYYEHPSIKYLPDFNLAGLTLSFDLNYSDGLQPIDSPKYNWIDWATLDCIREDGTTAQIRLWDNAMLVGSAFPAASVTCTLLAGGTGITQFDRATLWYQNLAFDYIVPAGAASVEFAFFAKGTGTVHSITVNGTTYSHTEAILDPVPGTGESSAYVAQSLANAVQGAQSYVTAVAVGNSVLLTVISAPPAQDGIPFSVGASDPVSGTVTAMLCCTSPVFVATQIAGQVNAANWASANAPYALMASTSGAAITLTAARYGVAAVSGTSLTATPDSLFSSLTAGSRITIAGLAYTVAGVQSPLQLTLTSAPPAGTRIAWAASGGLAGLANVSGLSVTATPNAVFSGLTVGSPIVIGGVANTVASVQSPTQLTLTLPASGTGVAWVAPRGGYDGNLIELYSLSKTSTLSFDQTQYQLTGGSSNVTWNCSIDFTALGIDSLRQCWLTFAPALVTGIYSPTPWGATFSNWQLSGPTATQQLQVAGPGSIRIDQSDSACTYSGTWSESAGFYSKYFANVTPSFFSSVAAGSAITIGGVSYTVASVESPLQLTLTSAAPSGTGIAWSVPPGLSGQATVSGTSVTAVAFDPNASVTVTYICQFEHDLWIGTSLYSDRANVGVSVDGDAATPVICQLATDTAIATRRQARTAIAAGRHTVTITPTTSGYFYFNFLEAAVASAVPDALTPRTGISPALDFDTNHAYTLPPARIMWIMDQLGYAGPMNEYLGVFWWNERKQINAVFSTATVTFGGTFNSGDSVFLTLNATAVGKSVFPDDTPATIAIHFAAMINGEFVGVWASAAGSVLTITGRSADPAYTVTLAVSAVSSSGGSTTGTAALTVAPQPGQDGTWVIDDTVRPPLNQATRDWHADFYAQCASRTREVVTSCSLELVNPPDGYAAQFPGGGVVTTATGFGSLSSTQCAVGATKVLAYQKAVYRCIAGLQVAAGLTPCVQYGEFLWWYFPLLQGMAVGYASYTAPISIGTATAHGLATGTNVSIAGVLGNTAANGTWTIAVTDPTHFTLNGSSGNGNYTGGGAITGGGMAYYDAETSAAALTALGRALNLFSGQNDDPAVNGSADAIFLRNRLRDHVAALVSDIRSVYSNVICEVLWPYDVNYPSPAPGSSPAIGGQLNYYVNLPLEWQNQASSGLDRMKVEALDFGSSLRNLDLALQAIELFPAFGWPLSKVRYLAPVFGSACPWVRELALALGAGITTNNLWALDHVCLFNLQVPEGPLERRSFAKTE